MVHCKSYSHIVDLSESFLIKAEGSRCSIMDKEGIIYSSGYSLSKLRKNFNLLNFIKGSRCLLVNLKKVNGVNLKKCSIVFKNEHEEHIPRRNIEIILKYLIETC